MAYIYQNSAWAAYDTEKYVVNTNTFTTYPFTIKSPTTPVNATIYGNMQQAGTPTPSSPIQPSECGEMTGNLFDLKSYTGYSTGISDVVVTGNTITYNAANQYLAIRYQFDLSENDVYYLSLGGGSKVVLEVRYFNDNTQVGNTELVLIGNSKIIRGKANVNNVSIYIGNMANTGECSASNIMFVSGSTAPSSFIPYGYKIPILSANTTTPVYLGEVQTTRKIKKYEFTGLEDWTYSASGGKKRVVITGFDRAQIAPALCSHFDNTDYVSYPDSGKFAVNASSTTQTMIFGITDMAITSATDWTTYLAQQYAAGTPVCVWYVLAEPTTGILNEPIRKIGDYADSVTSSIPVTINSDSVDITTTLKPSAVAAPSLSWSAGDDYKRSSGAWS